MRAAPPVSVEATGGIAWRVVRTLLPALAAVVTLAWGLGHAAPQTSAAVFAFAAASVALVVAVPAWRSYPPHSVALRWDGQWWSADGSAGRLDVAMDLGGWLLLRLHPADGARPRWIAVTATEVGLALHGLRAALYSQSTQLLSSLPADEESSRPNG